MLLDFDHGGAPVRSVPFQREFRYWKSNLTGAEIAAIKARIHQMLDEGDVHTTSWMPGSDWGGTPFDPIYWRGTKQDVIAAAKCFGLFVWESVLGPVEIWDSA
jgi:hypothetical protein